MDLRKFYIYQYTDTRNGMKYIGQAKDVKQRDYQHLHCGANPRGHFDPEYSANPWAFKLETIAVVYGQRPTNGAERYYIKKNDCIWPKGYNTSPGGGAIGVGENHPNYGIKLPEERIEWLREHNTGEGNPNYGNRWDEEQRQAASERMIARCAEWGTNKMMRLNPNRQAVIGINIKTKEVLTFESRRQAARWLRSNGYLKADHSAIDRVVKGIKHTAYGHYWYDVADYLQKVGHIIE